jgi:ectoine hydroxylase-related dioxygenase (phytanoyl-CoA dioxygenase family)
MPKLLSDAEVAQFKRDGYLFPVTAFGADEARDCAERVARYERETGKSAMKTLSFKAHVAFAMFSGLIRHPRILDAVEDVLGPDLVCWGSSFFLKAAHSPKYISWHADTYYYGLEPQDTVTVWVAFTPSNRASGCIRVIPGSHLEDTPFDQTPSEHNMLGRGQTTQDVDESAAVYMPLEPGQFSMHHERLVHSSEPNGADYRRIGYSIHYCPTHVRQTKFAGDDRPSAALVRGVDETGHWEHETMTTADFDPAAWTWAEEQRRRFLSRAR